MVYRGDVVGDDLGLLERLFRIGAVVGQSRSGIARNQGWEGGRGTGYQGVPQPLAGWADRSAHLWRARLPDSLAEGVHTLRATSTDRNGRSWTGAVTFEVRAEHPPARHRRGIWE